MKKNIYGIVGMCLLMAGSVSVASAAEFSRTGKVTRVLTTSPEKYGACMVLMDVSISNGCPSGGWVSLDCSDTHYSAGTGKRKYATALTALTIGAVVTVRVDNAKKFNGYCVASRIDIFTP